MHRSNISMVRSFVSKLQMPLRNVLAWCGTLVPLVRTFKQLPKILYLHKKRVPYKRKPYFLAKTEAYRTVLTYRTTMLGTDLVCK